jgi:ubiquinone/menaquinone biosynthesis C-methylase UbiE
MASESEIQDKVADYYVKYRYRNYGLKYHSSIIHEMMDGLSGTILDVGCGTGIIHDLYPDKKIIGIDLSRGMLRYHKGTYYVASATDIPFPDNYFNNVVCRSVLHHIPETGKALSEIRRVLKPGGKFVCWETNRSWLASIIRKMTQHGDHFSDFHSSFSNLPELIKKYFSNVNVKYEGYVAYPLLGFPDIINFGIIFGSMWKQLLTLDNFLSKIPIINRLGFAIMIKAQK